MSTTPGNSKSELLNCDALPLRPLSSSDPGIHSAVGDHTNQVDDRTNDSEHNLELELQSEPSISGDSDDESGLESKSESDSILGDFADMDGWDDLYPDVSNVYKF